MQEDHACRSSLKEAALGAGETAWFIERLMCNHEDQSSDPEPM